MVHGHGTSCHTQDPQPSEKTNGFFMRRCSTATNFVPKNGDGVSVCNFHRPPWAIMAARGWRCWHSQNATRQKVKSKIPENWSTCILGWCEHAKRYFHVGLIGKTMPKTSCRPATPWLSNQPTEQPMYDFFKAKTMEKNLCCHLSISLFDSTRS